MSLFSDLFSADYWSDWVDRTFSTDKKFVSPTSEEWASEMMDSPSPDIPGTSSAASDSQALDMSSLIHDLNSMEGESAETAFERQKELLSLSGDINSALAKEAFERSMEADSTKIQRYVADMKKAGINPIIAFSSGMPSIGSPSSSAASASAPSVAKASTLGESAIGKQESLIQGYIGMVASLIETGISTAGNIVGSFVGKSTPLPQRTSTTRKYSGRNYTDTYTYGS